MDKYIRLAVLMACAGFTASAAWAKLPPPPPMDPAAKAAADEKKAADAVRTKAEQLAAEDRAVKNYHDNMKKAGKPIPKPVPVTSAAAPAKPGEAKAAPADAKAAPAKASDKADPKAAKKS